MSQGSVLPPAPARAADVAAAGREGLVAADPVGANFGDLLQAQIDKGVPSADPKSALLPGVEPTAQIDPAAAVSGQAPIDAALLAAAVVAPAAAPVIPVTRPSVQAVEVEAVDLAAELPAQPVAALPVAPEGASKRADRSAPDDKLAKPSLVPATEADGRPDAPSAERETQAKAPPVPVPATDNRQRDPALEIRAAAAPQPVVAETPNPVHAGTDVRREALATVPVKVEIAQPVTAPAWRDAFADKVTWVANARQPAAELQINPPQLGPVEIRVSMNADQANLSFFSPHAAVREAIQASLPRLTDAFAASGLTLGNVLVGAESQSGRQPGEREAAGRYTGTSREEFSAPETPAAVTLLRPGGGLGRVDLFA
jgi:flagellar hook-length control protein FliK